MRPLETTIALAAFSGRGLAPRSHQRTDTPESIDEAAVDRTVEFGLMLVDPIDAALSPVEETEAPTPA
jgi:hypothetical protein